MAKGPEAFRTISEAAAELDVPQHVLRFWESKFSFIRPMKRAGGRRFYRPHDVAILRGVRRLLHDQGLTIKGVQRLHREEGIKRLIAAGLDGDSPEQEFAAGLDMPPAGSAAVSPARRDALRAALRDLEAAQARLQALLKR